MPKRCKILIIIFLSLWVGCATSTQKTVTRTPYESVPLSVEEKWGIKVTHIRLSAAGHMLDFRYRVIDSEKANLLLKRQSETYLIDQATGAKLGVPRTKLGPMRQTAVKPEANRDYFILFSNPGGSIKQGDKVTVVIGDFRIEDLVVE